MKKIILLAIFVFALFGTANAEKFCTREYDPVVWTDWQTYPNKCAAENAWALKKGKKIVTNEKILNSYLDFSMNFPMSETDSKKFLEKYGKICNTASDSVNIHFIENWKFLGSTRVWIPENFKPVYDCIAYKWLVLDFELKEIFEKSLEHLSVSEMKTINSALKKFYENEKDFFKNLEKTVKLVEKIEKIKMTSRFSSPKNLAILDYVKYQVIDLFTKK